MENKIKFNRFERYIPAPEQDGILRVNNEEDGMNFKHINDLNVEYGRDNLMCGFKPTFIETKEEEKVLYNWINKHGVSTFYTNSEDEYYIDEFGDKVRTLLYSQPYDDTPTEPNGRKLYSETDKNGNKVYFSYDQNHRKEYLTRMDDSYNKIAIIISKKYIKIGAGKALLHSKIANSFIYGLTNRLILKLPITGVKGNHTFMPATYDIDVTKHYEDKTGGADYSESIYIRPNMTSENYPYGVCWADNVNTDVDTNGNMIFLPWKAFNGTTTDGNDAYISINPVTGSLPCCLYYSVSDTNDKWVRPITFTVTNRNLSDKIRPMSTFLIQGSTLLHPYDDLDWETLVNVDGTNLTHVATNNGVGTYHVRTDKYYRHFRIKCLTINTTVPANNTMFAIGEWNIKGYTKDVIDVLNPVKKYFLVNVYNKTTEETYDMYVVSRADEPVLDDNLQLLDYYPIEGKDIIVNDYKNGLFMECPYAELVERKTNKGEHTVYLSQIYQNPEERDYTKLVCTYSVDESGNVIEYSPKDDIVNTYNERFVVQEQIGTIGYKIYSDGWKEQWGNNANPVFPIAFNEVPVIVERGATNVTNTGMTISAGYWFAKGY